MANDKKPSPLKIEVEIPAGTRQSREIFAINDALRRVKEQFLRSAPERFRDRTLVLTLTSRD